MNQYPNQPQNSALGYTNTKDPTANHIQDELHDRIVSAIHTLKTGSSDAMQNEMLEWKRTIDLEKKTQRLSTITLRLANQFFNNFDTLMHEKKEVEAMQLKLDQFNQAKGEREPNSREKITIRRTIHELRIALQQYNKRLSDFLKIFQAMAQNRYQEIKVEQSLLRSSHEYMNYVDPSQRGKLETQILHKLKNLSYEKRIQALHTFISTLMKTSPSVVQAEVQRLIKLAQEFLNHENTDSAMETLQTAIHYDPNHAPLYELMAQCYSLQQKTYEQIQWLKKAVELEPRKFQTLHALANAYESIQDFRNAVLYYQKALQLRPDRFSLLAHIARLAFENQLWIIAIPALAKVLEQKPHSIKTLRRLGGALVQSSQFKKGIPILRDAIRRDDSDGWIHFYLGKAYHALQYYTDAFNAIARAYQMIPDELEVQYGYAVGLHDRGDFDQTITVCKTILSNHPHHLDTLLLLSRSLRLTGQSREAVSQLESLSETGTKSHEILFELCQNYLKTGENEKAFHVSKKIVDANPNVKEYQHAFTLACIQSGRFDEATKSLASTTS